MLPGCVPWPEAFARRYRARGYWRGIARFKLPERLEIVNEFPISPAGKILRRELRARIAQQLQSESS